MQQCYSFFEGLTAEELARVEAGLEHRRYPAHTTVLTQGLPGHELYIIRAGIADVFVRDDQGREHWIDSVEAGATLGEMALFTGQPASATVRATTDLDVLVMSEAGFHRTAAQFPRIYENVGAILSRRLRTSMQRALQDRKYRVALLLDEGAPPLLGYALAASVVWHTRRPALFLVVQDGPLPDALAPLADPALPRETPFHRPSGPPRAHILAAPPTGAFAPEAIGRTLAELSESYGYVLVQGDKNCLPPEIEPRRVRLAGSTGAGNGPGAYVLRAWVEGNPQPRPNRDGVLAVPALTAEDSLALRRGVLPPVTPAGRAIGWAARDLARLKVGVAFGAGSEKGYAHIGVLRVLAQAGIPIDFLAGTSAGAGVATSFALGHSPETIAADMDRVAAHTFRLTMPTNSLLSSAGMRAMLRAVYGDLRFEDVPVPLAVIAADIESRQEVIFRRGLLWPALLASMSIPGIYPPQRMGEHLLVDGGILNPVPGDVVAGMGADIVIAVKLVSRANGPAVEAEARAGIGQGPTALQTIMRTVDIMQSKITAETAADATILITPAFDAPGTFMMRNLASGRRFIPAGEQAAQAALPRLAAALPWIGQVLPGAEDVPARLEPAGRGDRDLVSALNLAPMQAPLAQSA